MIGLNCLDYILPPLPWIKYPKKGGQIKNLVFIGAMARSGNHLIRGLLDGHPQLQVPPDEDFFIRSLAESRANQIKAWFCKNDRVMNLYQNLQKNGHFERVNNGEGENPGEPTELLNLGQYYQYVSEHYTPFSFANLCQTHFSALSQALQVKPSAEAHHVYFCALRPYLNDVINIGKLLSKYYNIKAVFVFRNPLATYSSNKKRNPNKNLSAFCRSVNKYVDHAEEFQRKGFGSVLKIRFEDMVLETSQTMKNIAEFLNIPFNDIFLKFTQNGKEIMNNSSFNRSRGIDSQSLYRYKKVLNEKEIDFIKTHCPDYF